MKHAWAMGALAVIALTLTGCEEAAPHTPESTSRSFAMGFTPWPRDNTAAAMADTWNKVRNHGDLIALHYDEGVPWPEALAGAEWAQGFQNALAATERELSGDHLIYLGLAPLSTMREGLASYRGESDNMPLPEPWDTLAFDDPEVIQAYTTFALEMIERFEPDWVNYAVEASGLLEVAPEKWDAFVRFCAGVYPPLKARFPHLPIGISVVLKHPQSQEAAALQQEITRLQPYFDYLAASMYPYVFYGHANAGDPAALPGDWLNQLEALAAGKPMAVAETTWIAEPLYLPEWGIRVRGTRERQDAYVRRLLREAQAMNMAYVVWWTSCDFDRLLADFPPELTVLGMIWRDTGLFDEGGNPRPGLASWDAWRNLPRRP